MSAFTDRYPPDLDHEADLERLQAADSGIYRRILQRIPIPGMPDQVSVGDVVFSFIVGPIRTQQTALRQRPGLPFAFDKHMRRGVEIGAGDALTVAELHVDLANGFEINGWRSRVDSAIGLLMCQLDERVAGAQLGEDVVLLAGNQPFAAAEQVAQVRTFMPFDVTDEDRAALAQLADVDLDAENPGTQAAALYAAAAREGPSSLGFLLMWLAVDAIAYTGKNQVRELQAAAATAGVRSEWLEGSIRELAGLRGRLAHGKPVDGQAIHSAFYSLEAIARALVGNALDLRQGWPTAPTASSFLPSTAADLGPKAGSFEEIWHEEGLPPAEEAGNPLGLARYDAVRGGHSDWISVTGGTGDERDRVTWATWEALTVLAVDASDVHVQIGGVDGSASDDLPQISADLVAIPRRIAAPPPTHADGELVLALCVLLAQQLVIRNGLAPGHPMGPFVLEVVAGWTVAFALREEGALVDCQPADPEDLAAVGHLVGLSSRGNRSAAAFLDDWLADERLPAGVPEYVKGLRDRVGAATDAAQMLAVIEVDVDALEAHAG